MSVIVLIRKPLGIGDLAIISPLIVLLEKKFPKNNIYIVTEYEKFINFDRALWIHPDNLGKHLLTNSIVISPMLVFAHFRYILQSRNFIGYFFSNKLVSNFASSEYKYLLTEDHYFKKIFPILDILNIKYDKSNLPYPRVTTNEVNSNFNNIVIAPYVNWKERQLPMPRLVRLIHLLLEGSKCKIVLLGSGNPLEVEFNKHLEDLISDPRIDNRTGCTSLLEANSLISESRLYVGNDSGPSHIAYLSARKSLVFFGSVRFEDRLPINAELVKNITCIDSRNKCNYFPCYDGLSKPHCTNSQKYSCISNSIINTKLIKELLN